MSAARDPRTEQAKETIGEDRRKSGFALNTHTHAEHLRSKGETELARILDTGPAIQVMDDYDKADRAAVASQMRFRRLCAGALITITLLIYVALVALALPLSEEMQRSARLWSIAAIYAGIVFGFSGLTWLYYSKPDVTWRQARARAEVERGRL